VILSYNNCTRHTCICQIGRSLPGLTGGVLSYCMPKTKYTYHAVTLQMVSADTKWPLLSNYIFPHKLNPFKPKMIKPAPYRRPFELILSSTFPFPIFSRHWNVNPVYNSGTAGTGKGHFPNFYVNLPLWKFCSRRSFSLFFFSLTKQRIGAFLTGQY